MLQNGQNLVPLFFLVFPYIRVIHFFVTLNAHNFFVCGPIFKIQKAFFLKWIGLSSDISFYPLWEKKGFRVALLINATTFANFVTE